MIIYGLTNVELLEERLVVLKQPLKTLTYK